MVCLGGSLVIHNTTQKHVVFVLSQLFACHWAVIAPGKSVIMTPALMHYTAYVYECTGDDVLPKWPVVALQITAVVLGTLAVAAMSAGGILSGIHGVNTPARLLVGGGGVVVTAASSLVVGSHIAGACSHTATDIANSCSDHYHAPKSVLPSHKVFGLFANDKHVTVGITDNLLTDDRFIIDVSSSHQCHCNLL